MSGARAILERLYGFAEPLAGSPEVACTFCGAAAPADSGSACHAADCPFWDARAMFDSSAARRLVAQLATGTV